MNRLITILFLLHFVMFSFGQNADIKSMVDSLQYLKVDTLDCKAELYWRIVSKGNKAIPFLIDKLTDTTHTKIKFHCKPTRLNVGEIAQFALTQIADFPTALVTRIKFDVFVRDSTGQSCWSFYDFLFNNSNKSRYQDDIRNWYNKEHLNYKTKRISKKKQTGCQKQYGIDKYYRWTD